MTQQEICDEMQVAIQRLAEDAAALTALAVHAEGPRAPQLVTNVGHVVRAVRLAEAARAALAADQSQPEE